MIHVKIISSVLCILVLWLVTLYESIFHGRLLHFQLGGVCFLSKRRILRLLPNRRRLIPNNWRSVFPKYLKGVFFHGKVSVSNGPAKHLMGTLCQTKYYLINIFLCIMLNSSTLDLLNVIGFLNPFLKWDFIYFFNFFRVTAWAYRV